MNKTLLVLFAFVSAAFGQNYLPPFEENGFKLQISGFGQAIWSDQELDGDSHHRNAAFQSFITRFELATPNPHLRFYARMEMLGIDERNANWLKRFYLEADLMEHLTLRIGRMHLSGARTIPMSEDLETIHEPRIPWPRNGNGIQLETKWGDGWKILADVTGGTSFNFDDSRMYNSIETSLRLSKSWNDGKFILAAQLATAGDSRMYGLDFKWKATSDLFLRGALYCIDDDARRGKGAVFFAGYNVLERVELHTQVDYRQLSKKGSDTIWTNGIRVWAPKHRVEFTLDHECVFSKDGRNEQRFFGRIEIPF